MEGHYRRKRDENASSGEQDRPAESTKMSSWVESPKHASQEGADNERKDSELTPTQRDSSLHVAKAHSNVEEIEDDLSCGFGPWRPKWLQRFLSKKAYLVIHSVIGLFIFAVSSYSGGCITTIEKRFKIPSRMSGMFSSAVDVGTCVSTTALAYFGMCFHKMRMVALGTLIFAFTCILRFLPQVMYGSGSDALDLTYEYGSGNVSFTNSTGESSSKTALCGSPLPEEEENCEEIDMSFIVPIILFFVAQTIHGMATSLYWTFGVSYLDDNTSKNKAPMVHAASEFIGLLGPTIGFGLATYTLSLYVNPTLHPRIDNTDPRWIGAWWLGWIPLAAVLILLSFIVSLFPRQLPRSAARRAARLAAITSKAAAEEPAVRRGFVKGIRHMMKNKILMCNILSTVCFVFANVGHWMFMPKYLETLFKQTSSTASFISGSMGLVCAGLGIIASGVVLTRFKPRSRYVAAWNVFVELLDIFCKFGWVFLGCGQSKLQGKYVEDGTWNMTFECNANCSCGPDVKFSPVCSADGTMAFFSPCHAGCNSTVPVNGTTMYTNCNCVPGGEVLEGACPMDCVLNLTIFLVTQALMTFLEATGKAGNLIIQFRCVHEEDKALSLAMYEFLISAFAFIPAPVIFGVLLDNSCLVWEKTCGANGNCWFYDEVQMRYLLNYTACAVTIMGTLLDVGVWYYSDEINLYDVEENSKEDVIKGLPLAILDSEKNESNFQKFHDDEER